MLTEAKDVERQKSAPKAENTVLKSKVKPKVKVGDLIKGNESENVIALDLLQSSKAVALGKQNDYASASQIPTAAS